MRKITLKELQDILPKFRHFFLDHDMFNGKHHMVNVEIGVAENSRYGSKVPRNRRFLNFTVIDDPIRQYAIEFIGGIAYDDNDCLCLLSGNRIRLRSNDDGDGILYMVP